MLSAAALLSAIGFTGVALAAASRPTLLSIVPGDRSAFLVRPISRTCSTPRGGSAGAGGALPRLRALPTSWATRQAITSGEWSPSALGAFGAVSTRG
jgi:hypothetical protein